MTIEQNQHGITVTIDDGQDCSKLFIPYDYELDEPTQGEYISSSVLFHIAQWLACHRYMPYSDNKCMLKRED